MSSNIPPDMKAFNQKVVEEFRANRGQLSGQMAASRVLLLTTTGARTGIPRTVVIGYRPNGNRYLAIASNNGNDHAPSWYHNLLAKPVATIEVGPESFEARARTATEAERSELAHVVDYLERQQALTKRQIPIVIFERVESSP
jgi:deazaflavin-dependent oxidoreductase (nitroreductase family)